jgi:hypothetical protein
LFFNIQLLDAHKGEDLALKPLRHILAGKDMLLYPASQLSRGEEKMSSFFSYAGSLRIAWDGQHRLQQQAVVGAIANGTQARGRGMVLVVHFGRVLDQQHPLLLPHRRSRLLDMRAEQLFIADIGVCKKR